MIDSAASAIYSSLNIKYNKLRDHPLHTSHLWMEMKREDDGAEGLWRIHDKLYDLSDFIVNHPGGQFWLRETKGTDITEPFESHHLSDMADKLLPSYYVRDAVAPRNYPFTFNDNGFYRTLKQRIITVLPNIPKDGVDYTKLYADALLVAYVALFAMAAYYWNYPLAVITGFVLCLTVIASHNFFHQKDNLHMYYFDLSMMSSKEWRISHALSHHMYTNSINDLEISALEPFLQYLPTEKNYWLRYVSWIISPGVYLFMFVGHFVRTIVQSVILKQIPDLALFIPFTVPLFVCWLLNLSFWQVMLIFAVVEMSGSLFFGLIGVNAAHHHPDIFHDGDAVRSDKDWGLYQIDAVRDRHDINKHLFLVLTNFGDHTLHHLFPTLDHGLLRHLYPVLLETMHDFGVRFEITNQLELVRGQYLQLIKRRPSKVAPDSPRRKLRKGFSVIN